MSSTQPMKSAESVALFPSQATDSKKPSNQLAMRDDVTEIYRKYIQGWTAINQPYAFLNGKTPMEYWADGRKSFNVYVPKRKDSKSWKTAYKSAITRNKCLGIIAHVIGMMMTPSIQAQNENQDEDQIAAQFFGDLVDYSQEKEGFDKKLFWAIVTAVAEGTVILKDDYGCFKREVKEITDIDENDAAKLTWTLKEITDFEGAYTEVIANDEFFVANPYINELQEQDWIIRRRRMTYRQFLARYRQYPRSTDVQPGKSDKWATYTEELVSFDTLANLKDQEVEVIEHWQKEGDHYDIVANGIGLTDEDSPNLRQDKEYPFAKSGYEPADANFFWYKALTEKMEREQEVYDAAMRIFIDREHLKNIPPLLTTNPSLVNEEIIIPGQVTHIGTKDKADLTAIPGWDTGADSGLMNLIQMMQNSMSDSSIDPMATGNTPVGASPTASQVVQMAKNTQVMLGLFGYMIGSLITDWTKLRINTLLWRLEHGEEFDLKKITLNDRILANGKAGKRMYFLEDGLMKRSDKEKQDLSISMMKAEKNMGGSGELVAIDPAELSNIELYVKADAQPKPKRTDELMQALAMEKWNVYSTRPDIFNVNLAAIKLAQAWGDNPDEMVIPQPQGGAPGGMPPMPGAKPQTPSMSDMTSSAKESLGLPPQAPNAALLA